MTAMVLVFGLIAGGWIAFRPLLGRSRWPVEPPDRSDDVARAVSSLRDLEFARAAGTIDPADEARLRARIEASAFARQEVANASAPVPTFAVAAILAGLVAIGVVAFLPAAAGDRAPGETITGSAPQVGSSVTDLEARVRKDPRDIPTRLALADAYQQQDRSPEAAEAYRGVLAIDSDNVPALNGLALLLFRAGSLDGAQLAVDRVLALRPRDADALFLKGLVLYQTGKFADAVTVWGTYLEVGEFHPAAPMVRSLYDLARERAGP